MAEKLQFRAKLAGILQFCEEKGKEVEKSEVEEYFREEKLSKEQMDLVFDYLLSQKIIVKGYVKSGGNVTAADGKKPETHFSAEEERYLNEYEQEIRQLKEDEPFARLLPKVIEMAKEMHREEVFIGDLVQEGNVGIMLAMEQADADEETILMRARESMQALLESQTEMKLQDRKMADRVNNLDNQIKKLTEEMGRKISVDELTQFLEMSEEEIEDILRLAGEDMPE